MSLHIGVTGFDHYVVKCSDVEASLAFYIDTLGLGPVRVDEWRAGEASFPSARISPDTIVDLLADAPDGTNVDHVCLVISNTDLDAVAAAFDGSVRVDGLFGARGYASSVYIKDPDDNTVELRCYEAADPQKLSG